jgi:predicted dehydrogenase
MSTVETPIRWGILSTAEIADEFASAVARTELAQVTAVASRDLARARAFAATHAIPTAYGGYDRILEDPQVDAVYVPLPNSLHARWALRALEAGKHVLCEKPLAGSVSEVDAIFDLAVSRGLQVMEGFMFAHHPVTRRALELVRRGALGPLRTIRSWHGFTVAEPASDIRYDPSLGGGALADLGCYCIAAAVLVAGEAPCSAKSWMTLAASGVDETTLGILTFPSQVRGLFDCSLRIPESAGLIIVGESAQIEIPSPWLPPTYPEANSYLLEIENFCQAIRGRAVAAVTRELSRGVATAIEMLQASAITPGQEAAEMSAQR